MRTTSELLFFSFWGLGSPFPRLAARRHGPPAHGSNTVSKPQMREACGQSCNLALPGPTSLRCGMMLCSELSKDQSHVVFEMCRVSFRGVHRRLRSFVPQTSQGCFFALSGSGDIVFVVWPHTLGCFPLCQQSLLGIRIGAGGGGGRGYYTPYQGLLE